MRQSRVIHYGTSPRCIRQCQSADVCTPSTGCEHGAAPHEWPSSVNTHPWARYLDIAVLRLQLQNPHRNAESNSLGACRPEVVRTPNEAAETRVGFKKVFRNRPARTSAVTLSHTSRVMRFHEALKASSCSGPHRPTPPTKPVKSQLRSVVVPACVR